MYCPANMKEIIDGFDDKSSIFGIVVMFDITPNITISAIDPPSKFKHGWFAQDGHQCL